MIILYKLSHIFSFMNDLLLGVDFERRIDEWDGHRYPYESTTCLSYRNMRLFIRDSVVPELINDGVYKLNILDVGSGKGKMLYIFSDIAYKLSRRFTDFSYMVSGLEYRKELVDISKLNIEKLKSLLLVRNGKPQRKIVIKVFYGDAETFDELDEYNLFYLYNPFDCEIMQAFIKNVEKSMERNPRTVWIIYCNPYFEEVLKSHGFKKNSFFFYNTSVYKKDMNRYERKKL